MRQFFSHKIKILFIFLMVIFIAISVVVWQKYPFGVQQYKIIVLGMQAAEKAGDSTGWAPPYELVSGESDFYVYSLGDETMCIGSDCGMGGYFIECLGGWISGYKNIGDVSDYGLRDVGVNINKKKVITIADKNAKIVGIYPGARIRNLPYIMRNHHNLISKDKFKECSDSLPRWWK
ncbi:MAG: hypothetical protein C0412_17235 [Flavobacterium sp.]|nr:hypothetical protein [Flavobacterium sp.]